MAGDDCMRARSLRRSAPSWAGCGRADAGRARVHAWSHYGDPSSPRVHARLSRPGCRPAAGAYRAAGTPADQALLTLAAPGRAGRRPPGPYVLQAAIAAFMPRPHAPSNSAVPASPRCIRALAPADALSSCGNWTAPSQWRWHLDPSAPGESSTARRGVRAGRLHHLPSGAVTCYPMLAATKSAEEFRRASSPPERSKRTVLLHALPTALTHIGRPTRKLTAAGPRIVTWQLRPVGPWLSRRRALTRRNASPGAVPVQPAAGRSGPSRLPKRLRERAPSDRGGGAGGR